jgi:hypothetical protein
MKKNLTILFVLLFLSCSNYDNTGREEPLAKVGDKYLYPSNLPVILSSGLSHEDSASISDTYINKWIRKQLLLERAELNISSEQQKEINNQLEETRASLIIYQYEKQMINQKLDTVVEENEILNYYDENMSNFVLDENIIKALFVKIPKDAPNISRVRNWYRSDRNEDLTELESYCYQFAEKYDDFDEDWISFDNMLNELPVAITDQERYLRYNEYIESDDSLYHYFVNIREFRLKTTTAPIEYVSDNIRTIILNNRKIQFLIDLENSIFNDALNRGEFEVYNY